MVALVMLVGFGCEARPDSPLLLLSPKDDTQTVEGKFERPSDYREYYFEGAIGEEVNIKVESPGSIRVTVVAPSGAEEGAPAGVSGMRLKETGKYRLRLTESPMGEGWSGTFRMTLTRKVPLT